MPLSEEELRMLEQMERALIEEDPKLASTLRGTSIHRAARRRAILGCVILLAGIGVLIGAVVFSPQAIPGAALGVVGFVVMLGGAVLAVTAMRAPAVHLPPGKAGTASVRESGHSGFGVVDGGRKTRSPRPRQRAQGSFMERVEERWRRRRERGF